MPEAYPIVLVYHIIHRKYTREIHNRSHWLASRAIKSHNSRAISASGPSYLRQYSDLFAAGAIEEGLCDQMLFGRMSFANPEFPKQILETGRLDPKKVCVSCGKCAQRCPLNNIRISDGKPVWNGNCTHCMACIGGCPTEAIEYKSASKGNRRYYIMKD